MGHFVQTAAAAVLSAATLIEMIVMNIEAERKWPSPIEAILFTRPYKHMNYFYSPFKISDNIPEFSFILMDWERYCVISPFPYRMVSISRYLLPVHFSLLVGLLWLFSWPLFVFRGHRSFFSPFYHFIIIHNKLLYTGSRLWKECPPGTKLLYEESRIGRSRAKGNLRHRLRRQRPRPHVPCLVPSTLLVWPSRWRFLITLISIVGFRRKHPRHSILSYFERCFYIASSRLSLRQGGSDSSKPML